MSFLPLSFPVTPSLLSPNRGPKLWDSGPTLRPKLENLKMSNLEFVCFPRPQACEDRSVSSAQYPWTSRGLANSILAPKSAKKFEKVPKTVPKTHPFYRPSHLVGRLQLYRCCDTISISSSFNTPISSGWLVRHTSRDIYFAFELSLLPVE